MLLFLPEHLYKINKDLVDEYQNKAKKLIENESLYRNLVSYVSEDINNENYYKMQQIWLELYDKLSEMCVDQDKEQLYICFHEEKALMELKNCKNNETILYCLYNIITNSKELQIEYIDEFEKIYNSLSNEEISLLSERIVLAHYLNLFKLNKEYLENYDNVLEYVKKTLNNVPKTFKTDYFINILKHHIIQYLPHLMKNAIKTSYIEKITNQQETLLSFKSFIKNALKLLEYEDYEYSFHYLKLCITLDGLLSDLSNYKEKGALTKEYIKRFKNDQRKAFFASNSHNYDPKEMIDYVTENKVILKKLFNLMCKVKNS